MSAPFWLRAGHAIVFIGFFAATVACTWPEWIHLFWAWSHNYHSGTPPNLFALTSAVVSSIGVVWLLLDFVRRRPASLVRSGIILLAFMASLASSQGMPQARTWAGADLVILDTAKNLHGQMLETMQANAGVPTELAPWKKALGAASANTPSPIRTRTFARVPFQIVMQKKANDRPAELVPGTILVWVSEDGVVFEVKPIGLAKDGAVDLLKDDSGKVIVLRGVFDVDAEQKDVQ